MKKCLFLIHGYTAEKNHMNPLEITLNELNAAQGLDFSIYNASIFGHDNATEEEFMQSSWNDWYSSVEEQFLQLSEQGYALHLIGHSMGGVIALHLAQSHQDKVASVTTVASPLFLNRFYPLEISNPLAILTPVFAPFIKKIDRSKLEQQDINKPPLGYHYPPQLSSLFKAMAEIHKNMQQVEVPLLVLQAFDDETVPHENALEIANSSASKNKKVVIYTIKEEGANKHQINVHPETLPKIAKDIMDFLQEI